MNVDTITLIKIEIRRYVVKTLPGYYSLINTIVKSKYGKELIEIMLSKPSILFHTLLEYYGDEYSAEMAIYETLIRPIAKITGASSDLYKVMQLIKEGRDKEALNTIIGSVARRA